MKNILSLITGKESDDSVSVRNAEKAFNRFPECWVEREDTYLESDKSIPEGKPQRKKATKRKLPYDKTTARKGKKSKASPQSSSSARKLPSASFRLKPGDLKTADQRASQIVVPVDCSFKPGPVFSKLTRLNSHALKEVSYK